MTIITENAINASQLTHELGVGVGVVGPEEDGTWKVRYADGSDDDQALQDAIDAHVKDDGWVSPVPEPHAPLDEFGRLLTLLALYEGQMIPPASELAAMGGYTEEQLSDEFYAWLEAAG